MGLIPFLQLALQSSNSFFLKPLYQGTGTFIFGRFLLTGVGGGGKLPVMPRAPRASAGGVCYHVINRGNARRQVFHKEGDYHAFLKALAHACIEVPLPVLGFCLMPNHFHLVVIPEHDGDLSQWMHWLQNTHVRRYHEHYHRSGHI
jgi:REP element-mobilizing transposase RayT